MISLLFYADVDVQYIVVSMGNYFLKPFHLLILFYFILQNIPSRLLKTMQVPYALAGFSVLGVLVRPSVSFSYFHITPSIIFSYLLLF
jgi:hypothetical protein